MPAKRINGALTWVLGLLTLVAVLSVFNAIVQLNLYGNGATTYFGILDATLGSLNVEAYFWMSVIIMFLLFTATCFSIYRGLPLEPQIMQRIAKVEESLAANTNMLENTQIGFFRKLEDAEKMNDEAFRKITSNLEETRKEVADTLDKQKTALLTIGKETQENTDNVKKQAAELIRIKKTIEDSSNRNTENVKKQATELSKIKKTIEDLGNQNNGKPKLTGQTKIQDFRTVTPSQAAKLSGIGITNVSELLAMDSTSIAEKTGDLPENIARSQAQAQLLMVPGIDEKHSELLVKCGVTSRRELANQDPVQLYRGLVGIAKTYVDQGKMPASKVPTIEDVSSWIKQAHL